MDANCENGANLAFVAILSIRHCLMPNLKSNKSAISFIETFSGSLKGLGLTFATNA